MLDPSSIRIARVGGINTAIISNADLIQLMLSDAPRHRRSGAPARLVFDVNAHAVSLSGTDPQYSEDLKKADLVHADGQLIVWASRRFCDNPLPDRSSTTDMFLDSLIPAAAGGTSYYLLGATEEVNALCYDRIAQKAPGIRLAGRHNGYFRGQEDALIDAINEAAPDILWVGLGKPFEQRFCVDNRHRLNVGWIVTCGGLFNYVTGHYSRAPRWMQDAGLEWLHRMAHNPRHLAWRYATTNPHALWRIWNLRNDMRSYG
jgi:exopolysaccharide biosynthesis WecB/TagA/CpsF family protein